MEKETKTILISGGTATVISVLGFLLNFYIFAPKSIQAEFKREMYKNLLMESSELYTEVNLFNSNTLSFFEQYGINSDNLDSLILGYFKTVNRAEKLKPNYLASEVMNK